MSTAKEDRLRRIQDLIESDPSTFKEVLDSVSKKMLVPHSEGQKDVLVSDARFMVLCAGRRWGKSKVGAAKIIRECRNNPGIISWWVAPTYRVCKRGYEEVIAQIPSNLLARPAPSSASFDSGRPVILNFKNGSKMEFFSGDRPESMLGGSCDFLIMDEAATLKQDVWSQNIRPTLADRQGRALFISTPRGRNWFYYLWNKGQKDDEPEYKSWHFPSRTNPTIPASEFDAMKDQLPQSEYEQEILAKFVSGSSSVFDLKEDEEGYLLALKEMHPPKGQVILGIDLAKHGDFTVLCGVRSHDRMPCYNDRFNQVSWTIQRQKIHEAVREILASADGITIVMDTTGVGDVMYDDLTEEGLDIIPINFTHMKERMVKLLSADLERGRAFICEDQLEEFEHYTSTMLPSGKWRYEAASGHDDQVSAAMLAHWGAVNEGAPNAQMISWDENSVGGDYSTDYDDDIEHYVGSGEDVIQAYHEDPLNKMMEEEFRMPTVEELMRRDDVWGS